MTWPATQDSVTTAPPPRRRQRRAGFSCVSWAEGAVRLNVMFRHDEEQLCEETFAEEIVHGMEVRKVYVVMSQRQRLVKEWERGVMKSDREKQGL